MFKPLLYDFVAGTAKAWEVAPYFQQLLAPYNINFLQVRVEGSGKLHSKSAAPSRKRLSSGDLDPGCAGSTWQLFHLPCVNAQTLKRLTHEQPTPLSPAGCSQLRRAGQAAAGRRQRCGGAHHARRRPARGVRLAGAGAGVGNQHPWHPWRPGAGHPLLHLHRCPEGASLSALDAEPALSARVDTKAVHREWRHRRRHTHGL